MRARWLLLLVLAAAGLRPAEQHALPRFVDVAAAAGVSFRNQSSATAEKYLPEAMTGGVAAFDYDGDGRLDLYFVNGAALQTPMPERGLPDKADPGYWNRLYLNEGNWKFRDVTEQAGLRGAGFDMGAAVGDYDNDGRPDLYVTSVGRNILYHNNGDGTFTDVTANAGVAGGGWSASAVFFDFDKDGKLDLFVTRYVDWTFGRVPLVNPWCGDRKPGYRAYCHPDQFPAATHLLFRNNGDGTFSDVSAKSGIAAKPGKGLGVAIADYDRDGWPDVLVANDSVPQQLFHNRGDGTFEETALGLGLAYDDDGRPFAGMGADFGDYDNDGWPDVFVNALGNQRYALFHNLKNSFDYVSGPSGVGAATMLHSGWGAKLLDYDNDGSLDLFVAQGHVMDNIELTQPSLRYLEPLLLLRNQGGKFQDVSAASGAPFQSKLAARGAAVGDFDNDGWPDLAINCNNGPAMLLHNEGAAGRNWLLLELTGRKSNREGIDALVTVRTAAGLVQTRRSTRGGSYASSSDRRVHFGLGAASEAGVTVEWPSGAVQRVGKVKAGQILRLTESALAGDGK